MVDDYPHVGFVDTHTKSVGGHDDACAICCPRLLTQVFLLTGQAGMIESCIQPCFG